MRREIERIKLNQPAARTAGRLKLAFGNEPKGRKKENQEQNRRGYRQRVVPRRDKVRAFPGGFLFNMKKTKRTQTAKSKAAGTLQRQSAEPKFRRPVRSEIVAAVALIRSCFFDREMRDFDFDDYWAEHCLQFLLKEYLQKTN